MKIGSKEWRRRLKDKCKICGHTRGSHNDVGHCGDCYEEDISYKNHKFVLKGELLVK